MPKKVTKTLQSGQSFKALERAAAVNHQLIQARGAGAKRVSGSVQALRAPVQPTAGPRSAQAAVQPKSVAPAKAGANGTRQAPAPPPMYRPVAPKVLQPKATAGPRPVAGGTVGHPKAPAPYRPQPVPVVLRGKNGGGPQSVQAKTKAGLAPPPLVGRPQPSSTVVQRKEAARPGGRKLPGARPAPPPPNFGVVQRALLIINQDNDPAIALDATKVAHRVPGGQSPEVATSLAEIMSPVANGNYNNEKDFHVLAHAGLAPHPWVGGMGMSDFADALVAKYGAVNLEGGRVFLLVCMVGNNLQAVLTRLHTQHQINNLQIYAPTSFMWVSAKGQPHVHTGNKSQKDLEKLIKKYTGVDFDLEEERESGKSDSQIMITGEFKDLGEGWGGAKIVNGVISKIPPLTVEGTIREVYGGDDDYY